jgi:methylmalonyl-CoA/ethylmalonyl-CoA epimerase
MNVSRLHQVAQHAADLGRATAFYRDILGLRHIATYDPPGLVFFDLGGTRLLLETAAAPALLYLEVADITATWEALGAAGVERTDPPHMIFADEQGEFGPAGTEEWMAFFKDSEGNTVGLVERRLTSDT